MINPYLIKHLESSLDLNIHKSHPLSGGDINDVYLLETNLHPLVIKLNVADKYPEMFSLEKQGLEKLQKTKAIHVPDVLLVGEFENHSYLILEYIPQGNPTRDFWEVFGRQMAELHQNSNSYFGLDHDNYIGSLLQYNASCDSATKLYEEQRIQPQLKLAVDKGYQIPDTSNFFKNVASIIPEEQPALIHGDLWSGNFLINSKGLPTLIDPSVSYFHREYDLAMMLLFGGFKSQLFDSYHEAFPLAHGWKQRVDLWQLYALLVHLNLFGGNYYSSVISILKKYS